MLGVTQEMIGTNCIRDLEEGKRYLVEHYTEESDFHVTLLVLFKEPMCYLI